MKGLCQKDYSAAFANSSKGSFIQMDGELYYKIENYDLMDNFFMTITSSTDVWNTLWSQGGITAGRIDCDHAVFPYYTADKIADGKDFTGSYTGIIVEKTGEKYIWQPFTHEAKINYNLERNLYKNTSGSKVYFEEINKDLGLTFKYGWTSSDKYGLVKHSIIQNMDGAAVKIQVLDGCRNILPACADANFQNVKSVLLDAYKKTDFDVNSGLTVFSLSSVPTDKAEPSEGLFGNVSWFTTNGKILTDDKNIQNFLLGKPVSETKVLKGGRPACLINKEISLGANACEEWYQVFDTFLSTGRVIQLKKQLAAKADMVDALKKDIEENMKNLEQLIYEADGIQNTGDITASVHHKANVLFNIMRGGIFADNGNIHTADFVKFVGERNKAYLPVVEQLVESAKGDCLVTYEQLSSIINKANDPQLERLFLEYLPLIFSRRHGDPSRPWNRFSIKITDADKNRIFNYEGNWRDIFQNWEALCMSYPAYTKNIIAKFLNAMTIDGFNPYRISREGVDWEILDPTDPWSNIGYWNDHQVIYLQKMLELQNQLEPELLDKWLNTKLFSTSNIPYRLKSYQEMLKNPRSTVLFEKDLSSKMLAGSKTMGTDLKLWLTKADDVSKVELSSMLTKIVQIILAKLANFIPGGGIWMNTQRPEWNDANNALAGYGLSMVTLYYLYRMISFLKKLIEASASESFALPQETAVFLEEMFKLYKGTDPSSVQKWTDAAACKNRKAFVDIEGMLFQTQREALYANGHSTTEEKLSKAELLEGFAVFMKHLEATIDANKRPDGLYHAYNILHIGEDSMAVSDLTLMLEGQVAALSSGYLSAKDAAQMTKALKASPLYVADRNTYILYPDKELPLFWDKNNFAFEKIQKIPAVAKLMAAGCSKIFVCDDKNPAADSTCHFNSDFRNVDFMRQAFAEIKAATPDMLSSADEKAFEDVYESIFNHQSFTGRSGTFYAYEGLGSVYWHMVAKLLVAVQEYIPQAQDSATKQQLVEAYYSVRSGIGFNKTPAEYGAFPTDPYSHTPAGQGAKQPGMTGQVKEEIITRWGELGINLNKGQISFAPEYLLDKEYDDNKLSFTRFGIPFTYEKCGTKTVAVTYADGKTETVEGNTLDGDIVKALFNRSKDITSVKVKI